MTGIPDEDYKTPSTERVRTKFATVLDDTSGWKFSDEWAGDFDRWLAAHDAALLERVKAAEGEGCDCKELCSMGPTCPGGMLAGLEGSGCWRTGVTE